MSASRLRKFADRPSMGSMRLTLHAPHWLAGPRVPGAVMAAGGAALVAAGFAFLIEDATELESEGPRMDGPTLALCEEGAVMLFDVQWAAACSTFAERGLSDSHAECELPPAEAERLNRLLRLAERQCQADAAAAMPR